MRRMMLAPVMGSLIATLAVGQATIPKKLDERQVADWTANYYEDPRPEWTPSVLHFAAQHKMLGDPKAAIPLAMMIGQVIRENPDRARAWVNELGKVSNDDRWILANAIYQSTIPDAQELIQTLGANGSGELREHLKQLSGVPADPLGVTLESPTAIDVMWACFIATGDVRYAKRVLDVAVKDEGSDASQSLVIGAARWSLTSNAHQHKKVLDMCEAELPNFSGDKQTILADVIRNAKKTGTK